VAQAERLIAGAASSPAQAASTDLRERGRVDDILEASLCDRISPIVVLS